MFLPLPRWLSANKGLIFNRRQPAIIFLRDSPERIISSRPEAQPIAFLKCSCRSEERTRCSFLQLSRLAAGPLLSSDYLATGPHRELFPAGLPLLRKATWPRANANPLPLILTAASRRITWLLCPTDEARHGTVRHPDRIKQDGLKRSRH